MKYLREISILITLFSTFVNAEIIYDKTRDRNIPVEITYPTVLNVCTSITKCPVAFLSAGYGVSHEKYTFISQQLNQLGYLVVAVGHELPNDPPLSISGNLYETRSENWRRGAQTLSILKNTLSKRFRNYDFEQLLLIGHSNGGDISAWLGNEGKPYVAKIITLDHRRVPLPRTNNIDALSIRASDFLADDNVLPSKEEQAQYHSCVVMVPDSKHNEIYDDGPSWVKQEIKTVVKNYLNGQPCSELNKL